MRTFYFKARVIGQEKYLTYTMGEDCELDEDVLDYCEENKPAELVDIIYEEDDDYDYLTYDISGKSSLDNFIKSSAKCEQVLMLLRNIANSLISLKEQTVHLNYILLNRNFVYVDDSLDVKFLCVPVESKASLATEFKGFVRELLANMIYDVDENLDYVGKLLTYINGESFNLRGLIGLAEALMEESGISYEEVSGIEADGVEVMASSPVEEVKTEGNLSDFMNSDEGADEPLPEIGDDEDDGEQEEQTDEQQDEQPEEIESIVPDKFKEDSDMPGADSDEEEQKGSSDEQKEVPVADREQVDEAEETEKAEGAVDNKEAVEKNSTPESTPTVSVKETDVDVIKSRLKAIVEGDSKKNDKSIKSIEDLDNILNRPPTVKKNVVKVNRAALIQSAAEHEEESGEEISTIPVVEEQSSQAKTVAVEEIASDMNVEKENKPKSSSILSKTVEMAMTPFTTAAVVKVNPYLIRVNTEERIMINKPIFKLGKSARGVDYTVGGNGAISRQHAIIIQKDGVCYIRDNKSTNHTYVNDRMVEEGVDEILTHDSLIRLGDEEFRFKIR